MAQYNFGGNLDSVTELQLEFIHSVIVDLGFENSKVIFEPVGKPGDNYAACVKRIIIDGENGKFSMVAKIAPSDKIAREAIYTFSVFKNEHIMYSKVLPIFDQLQKDANIPEEDQLKYAKCYGSYTEQPNEVILLQDLNQLDFKMLDRFKPLSNECIMSVLKNFAVFHSLSYVLKQKEPGTYDELKMNLFDLWATLAGVEEMKSFCQNLEDETISVLENPDHINLMKNKIVGTLERAPKLSEANKENKFAVIMQGDSWTNNIMFRFKENTLAESIMIDYQLSKNGSPVYDIMYLILSCTDHEIRTQHYHDWIDYYYSELEKSLSNFNLNANIVYPRDMLDADLKRYSNFMLGMCVIMVSLLIRKSDDAAKLLEAMQSENIMGQAEEISIGQLGDETRNLYKNKVIGIIRSLSEFGLL